MMASFSPISLARQYAGRPPKRHSPSPPGALPEVGGPAAQLQIISSLGRTNLETASRGYPPKSDTTGRSYSPRRRSKRDSKPPVPPIFLRKRNCLLREAMSPSFEPSQGWRFRAGRKLTHEGAV